MRILFTFWSTSLSTTTLLFLLLLLYYLLVYYFTSFGLLRKHFSFITEFLCYSSLRYLPGGIPPTPYRNHLQIHWDWAVDNFSVCICTKSIGWYVKGRGMYQFFGIQKYSTIWEFRPCLVNKLNYCIFILITCGKSFSILVHKFKYSIFTL